MPKEEKPQKEKNDYAAKKEERSRRWTMAQFISLLVIGALVTLVFFLTTSPAGGFLILGICMLIVLFFLRFAKFFNDAIAEKYNKAFLPLVFFAVGDIILMLLFLLKK